MKLSVKQTYFKYLFVLLVALKAVVCIYNQIEDFNVFDEDVIELTENSNEDVEENSEEESSEVDEQIKPVIVCFTDFCFSSILVLVDNFNISNLNYNQQYSEYCTPPPEYLK